VNSGSVSIRIYSWSPKKKSKRKQGRINFEEIMAENFSMLVENSLKTEESTKLPNRINTKQANSNNHSKNPHLTTLLSKTKKQR
jgi:hypothetical protein